MKISQHSLGATSHGGISDHLCVWLNLCDHQGKASESTNSAKRASISQILRNSCPADLLQTVNWKEKALGLMHSEETRAWHEIAGFSHRINKTTQFLSGLTSEEIFQLVSTSTSHEDFMAGSVHTRTSLRIFTRSVLRSINQRNRLRLFSAIIGGLWQQRSGRRSREHSCRLQPISVLILRREVSVQLSLHGEWVILRKQGARGDPIVWRYDSEALRGSQGQLNETTAAAVGVWGLWVAKRGLA